MKDLGDDPYHSFRRRGSPQDLVVLEDSSKGKEKTTLNPTLRNFRTWIVNDLEKCISVKELAGLNLFSSCKPSGSWITLYTLPANLLQRLNCPGLSSKEFRVAIAISRIHALPVCYGKPRSHGVLRHLNAFNMRLKTPSIYLMDM